jgi:FkbM family methyltransferase
MVEVGAFWAYYSNWYLGAVAGSTAVCVEPDARNMACGQRNLALNGRSAVWINACVGVEPADAVAFRRESDGTVVSVPCHSLDSLLDEVGRQPVELLHLDCQGAELPLLTSMERPVREGLLRFVVVSTHHASISGSATTHQDCLRQLQRFGATILCEHTVEESFSGDGLIVASFLAPDSTVALPAVSRNDSRRSLFQTDGGKRVILADTNLGTMLVYEDDTVIGRALRHAGHFEEDAVVEVVRFLRHRYGFRPQLFLDIGANIGTHLLRGLRDGMFPCGVGVEMDPDNFRLLACNVQLADCQRRARLFDLAVSDRTGFVVMEQAHSNLGDHRVRGDMLTETGTMGEQGRSTRRVACTTLDALETACETAFDSGTLIWIDTQGHEGHVLAGAEGVFARDQRPCVVVEFWPYGVERCGGRTRLFRFLRRCRVVYDIRHPGWETLPPVSVAALELLYDKFLTNDDRERVAFTDLLCIA